MSLTYPIWLFFSAFFFYYAYAHWRESGVQIRPFRLRSRGEEAGGLALDPALAEANREFVLEFNESLAQANRARRVRHRAVAIGYGLSGLVALASMFMLLAGSQAA